MGNVSGSEQKKKRLGSLEVGSEFSHKKHMFRVEKHDLCNKTIVSNVAGVTFSFNALHEVEVKNE